MAGERKGITYEAFVKIALDELVQKGKLRGTVFWNEKPDGMTIEPDFTIGPDKDHPTHVFLVTHSGAAGNSHMKFWRNLGELAESKIRLPKPARVYTIAFDTVIKQDLKALQAAAFDGQLLVGDADYGRRLQWWVDANGPGLPKDSDEKVEAIRAAATDKARSDNPKALLAELVKDLGGMISTTRPELDGLWARERKRPGGKAPASRDTFVRRGLAKLSVLPEVHRQAVANGARTFPRGADLGVASRLGVVSLSITGWKLSDPESLNALSLLPRDDVKTALMSPPSDGVSAVIAQVASIGKLEQMVEGLIDNFSALSTPKGMLDALVAQHADPSTLFAGKKSDAPSDVWLFRLVCDLVKAISGLKQGYGYAQLVSEIKDCSEDSQFNKFVRSNGKNSEWTLPKSTEPVRRGLQDYLNRIGAGSFSRSLLAAVSYVLARRLADMSRVDIKRSSGALAETWISSTFEARLLTHRGLDPVRALLMDHLSKLNPQEVYLRACFAEAASTSSDLSGTTKVVRVKNTLVNWQSASDEGKDHKKKELCGRAPALRYTWDKRREVFVRRPAAAKLLLVVDGTWSQDDLNALALAGWDEIFYPDEMSRLVASIV
jgi:hypothetical protein